MRRWAWSTPAFDLGLVPCFLHPRRQDGYMVVLRHRRKGSVDVGLVVGRVGHCRFQIVGHEVFGAASIASKARITQFTKCSTV